MIRIKDHNGKVALFYAADTRTRALELQPLDAGKVKRNTKRIGIVSEIVAMQHFAAAGFELFLPIGDAAPYDILLDDRRGNFFRIQVKTGRLRKGCVVFSCVSNHGHRKAPPTEYIGTIDAFGIYCPDNGEFYVVPISAEVVTKTVGSLRVAAPLNNMRKTIKWASHYRFDGSDPAISNIGVAVESGAADGD